MILTASPRTPMIVRNSYSDGIERPIMRLNMTLVPCLRFSGYATSSMRSSKVLNRRSFCSLLAGRGFLGTWSAWYISYMIMVAAWDRFRIGNSSPVGTQTSTSHFSSSSCRSPMSSLPNTSAIFSWYPLHPSANSLAGTGMRV